MSDQSEAEPKPSHGWTKPIVRLAASVLILGHLMAVFLPPLSFQARGEIGPSPSVQTLLSPVRHYAEAIHTDRGYAFFAPDPGPSHLIQAAITDVVTGQTTTRMIPDLQDQWPRLLYHRHFMLAEFFHNLYRPAPPSSAETPAEIDSDSLFQTQRDRYVRLWNSIHRRLAIQYASPDGILAKVATRRIEHAVPNYVEYMRRPIPLSDPVLYRVLLDAPVAMDERGGGVLLAPANSTQTRPEEIEPPAANGPSKDASAVTDPDRP